MLCIKDLGSSCRFWHTTVLAILFVLLHTSSKIENKMVNINCKKCKLLVLLLFFLTFKHCKFYSNFFLILFFFLTITYMCLYFYFCFVCCCNHFVLQFKESNCNHHLYNFFFDICDHIYLERYLR